MSERCYHDEWNNVYYKYYIGGRTEKFVLPPHMNTSFSIANIGDTFEELPGEY